MASNWHVPYRPDIDGLRTLAIGSVFLFHLDAGILPGGFVGVDVFFVISGYLITTLLVRDLVGRRLSYLGFIQRRVARLLPAILVVLAATLIAARFVYSAQDFASTGVVAAAAIVSLANVKLFLQGSYFELSADAQPLLHFWSLSVEEQYYVVVPLGLLLLSRLKTARLGLVLLALTLVSFLTCAMLTPYDPKATFYLLPFRVWELGVGGLAAFLVQGTWGKIPVASTHIAGIAGLLVVIGSFLMVKESMDFPGYAAFFSVLATAGILLAGHERNYPGRAFLALPPMIFVGRLSYSLYLWHWPVFSLVDYALFDDPQVVRVTLKVVLTIVLSVLTFFLVEVPARRVLNRPNRRWVALSFLATSVVVIVVSGLAIRDRNYLNVSVKEIAAGGRTFPGALGSPTILLSGDSNGAMYAVMLRDLCHNVGCTFITAARAAGNALPGPPQGNNAQWQATLDLIARTRPDVVVLANAWAQKLANDPTVLDQALSAIEPYAGRVLILNQPPVLPLAASREAIRGGSHRPFFEADDIASAREKANQYLQAHQGPKVDVLDVSSLFAAEDGGILFRDENGLQMYQDKGHLSGGGANRARALVEAYLARGF